MLEGRITDVEDISEEYFPDFRVHALIRGRIEVFRVWLKTDHNEWAVYGDDGFRYMSGFPDTSPGDGVHRQSGIA